jgi:hypothetical protein
MKFGTFLSLLCGTTNLILTIVNLLEGQNKIASVWGVASIWAFSTFFTELNLNRKEKQIQNIKDAIVSSENEVEAINKINDIL